MAFFEDLTPYTYFHPEEEAPGTVNVGWLEPGCRFPTGTTGDRFQAKLEQLCHRRVKQTRGFHLCGLCPWPRSSIETRVTGGLAAVGPGSGELPQFLGSSFEMRVAGVGVVFAAPSLVHHYVVAHGYRPPDEFIAAVLAWDETAPRLSQEEVWARVCKLKGREVPALSRRCSYRIASVDQVAKRYEVEYSSGSGFFVSSDELYALYRELYVQGSLTNSSMKDNVRRVLGWSSWNRRGSAVLAILPGIDDGIRVAGGSLRIWWPLVGESATEDHA
jgi:hypothetical protein